MSNKLKFGAEARESLRAGAEQVYKAVSPTLGARGGNNSRQKFGRPKITNDGVSIARSIDLEDSFEKQGADLLKEAAEKTNGEAGDGTTTAITLAYIMFSEGLKLIAGGMNSMVLRKRIETEVERIQVRLKEMAIPVSTEEDLNNVANISVENPEYGKIVADAIRDSGKDGIVIVQEDTIPGIHKELVSGYRFDRGWENAYLVTNPEKMEAVLEGKEGSPLYILVADKSWNLVGDLLPMFEEIKKVGCDKLLIIAEEISGELMQLITLNRMKLRFHAVVVKTPFNKDMLEDIATLTGATAITGAKGIVNVKMSHLGTAKKIIVTQTTTTIIDGGGIGIENKTIELRAQSESADEGYEKEKLQERLAKLTGKTVILKVGAATEAEAKYLKDKLDDAVNATKAATEEGIVPGGGMALFRIAVELYPVSERHWWDFFFKRKEDFNDFMTKVLVSPLDKVVKNSGMTESETRRLRMELVLDKNKNSGYDALKGEMVSDIIKAGIIDPVKVTRCALKYATSLAVMLLTIESVLAEIPEVDNLK